MSYLTRILQSSGGATGHIIQKSKETKNLKVIKGGCILDGRNIKSESQEMPLLRRKSHNLRPHRSERDRRNGLYLSMYLYVLRLVGPCVEQEKSGGSERKSDKLLE